MKAKDLILITSDLESGFLSGPDRARWITRLRAGLEAAQRLDLNPILVLGPHGDEILLLGPNLESCDLAFDPNFDGDLFSSIQAGLHATTGAAFVWPLSSEPTPDDLWHQMDRTLWGLRPDQACDGLRCLNQAGQPLFPQLVSISGAHKIRSLPARTSWGQEPLVLLDLPADLPAKELANGSEKAC